MRFLSLLSAVLGATSLAAAAAEDKFQSYHSASKGAPIELDDSVYADITSAPRDYHVAVLLTAMDARLGCQLCREFDPEWTVLVRSWNKGPAASSRLLFGTLDFSRGRNTFQKLMLQTAPVVLFFPPTIGPAAKADGAPFRYDFSGPVTAEQLNAWISRHVADDPNPPIIRPVNYARIVALTTVVLGAISIFTVASPYVLPIVQSRNLWAALCLIAVLLFTSGHMFNHIRKAPYVAGDGKGGISYFASGFSTQLVLESQIVAAIYAVLSFATIALAMKTPRITEAKGQQASVILWAVVIFLMYSLLLSTFRMKNGGYPFYLPPF